MARLVHLVSMAAQECNTADKDLEFQDYLGKTAQGSEVGILDFPDPDNFPDRKVLTAEVQRLERNLRTEEKYRFVRVRKCEVIPVVGYTLLSTDFPELVKEIHNLRKERLNRSERYSERFLWLVR